VGTWLLDMGMLVALSALFIAVAALLLRRQEPAVMRK
jgi:hypothetical protein